MNFLLLMPNVVLGLSMNTKPIASHNKYNFVDAFGFNNTTLDGVDLLMPRLGFTYELSDSVELEADMDYFQVVTLTFGT